MYGQFQRNGEHIETEHSHPTRAITLFDMTARRERFTSVKDTDVIQPKEATLEYIQPFGILAIDPPGKVKHQFVEHALQERTVTFTMLFLINLVDAPRRPGQHRWI